MNPSILKAVPKVVGLVFLYAGISKLFYPVQAVAALESLEVPTRLAALAVFVVITIELYLGIILMSQMDLKWGLAASMGLMFLFVVFLWYLGTRAKPPSCGCLGLTRIFHSTKHEAWFGLARNCLIFWALKRSYDFHFGVSGDAVREAAPTAQVRPT